MALKFPCRAAYVPHAHAHGARARARLLCQLLYWLGFGACACINMILEHADLPTTVSAKPRNCQSDFLCPFPEHIVLSHMEAYSLGILPKASQSCDYRWTRLSQQVQLLMALSLPTVVCLPSNSSHPVRARGRVCIVQ